MSGRSPGSHEWLGGSLDATPREAYGCDPAVRNDCLRSWVQPSTANTCPSAQILRATSTESA